MPLHKRLPKVGFNSQISLRTAEVPLSALNKVDAEVVDLQALKESNVISSKYTRAKGMLSGELTKKVNLKGIAVTKGAKAAIEKLGGTVE